MTISDNYQARNNNVKSVLFPNLSVLQQPAINSPLL